MRNQKLETLKAIVLEYCNIYEAQLQNGALILPKCHFNKNVTNGFGWVIWGMGFELELDESIPADADVWGFAAYAFDMVHPPIQPPHPLLLEAFKIGAENVPLIGLAKFSAWLAMLPADTLAADRELVAKYMDIIDMRDFALREYSADWDSESVKLESAIRRLVTAAHYPLVADLELLARHLQCGSITIDVQRTGILSDESVAVYKSLQRVLGMEVQS